ncbi:hypothetical protein DL98DRAFT_593035 [Cadophora sp. DSE1049]|nr:hypothetical protein DL98DRAFT_593035 [Cadophora sp. DSE1049]
MVIELVTASNARRLQAADWRLNELEETMGQHEYINRPMGDPLAIDFIATTRTLNTTSRMLGVERMRLGANILALEMILKEIKELRMNISAEDCSSDWQQNGDGSKMITELVAYQMNACQNLVLRAEYQEKRVQSQIAVVYQFMAQKDSKVNISLAETSATIAQESKKDSSSMKAIAILTMCFLPGTFIAAIFAMPLFNWDGNGMLVIKDGFRYYWATAIPLTVLVLVMCALAMLLPWRVWLRRMRDRAGSGDLESAKEMGKEA